MSEQYYLSIETPQGNYELKAASEKELSLWNSEETVAIIRNLVRFNSEINCNAAVESKYRLTLKTPNGSYQIEAVSAVSLILLSSSETTGIIAALIGSESKLALGRAVKESLRPYDRINEAGFNLDVAAMDALETLYANKTEPCRRYHGTTISQAGLELDLVKCYLQGMTATQIIEWLKKNKGFNTGPSVVGRYISALWRCGIHTSKKTIIKQEV